jgi:hypothetical protein
MSNLLYWTGAGVWVAAALYIGIIAFELWLFAACDLFKWTKRYCWRIGPLCFRIWSDGLDDLGTIDGFTLLDGSKWAKVFWRFYRRTSPPPIQLPLI